MQRSLMRRIVLVAVVAVVVVSAVSFGAWRNRDAEHAASDPSATDSGSETGNVLAEELTVSLPEGKLSAAGIQVEPVQLGTLTHRHSVPGRVAYNDNRHIEVTAPTGGILTEICVKPGDQVQAGQVLAWLNSPEIGSARADVLQRTSAAEIAQQLASRARMLEQNVNALTGQLKDDPDFDTLQKSFTDRVLGNLRDSLFGAYSRMQLAAAVLKNSADLAQSGALSEKVVQERQAEMQAAQAALESQCEQARLDVWKERSQAEAAALDAQRRLEIARQHLASLLLNESVIHTEMDMPQADALGASDDDLQNLSRVPVPAPFEGTIERRTFSATERVRPGDSLFVLADTRTLWITAEIRENDWPAVSIRTGQTLQVMVPAFGDVTLDAKVDFIGREVSTETNAIPIVATIDNSDGRLRPGLFVRVSVPVGVKQDVLTVPSRSVLQHDGQSFVFVSEGPNRFRRVNVETGDEGDGIVEVVGGLKAGAPVVTNGAFVLKSELLLESEE
ncbi:efflux RND transporter periplasmic adaptor subunit [bacterium]|nr:efflux RND transporter periplasmic adaptor subunit [bacterium]